MPHGQVGRHNPCGPRRPRGRPGGRRGAAARPCPERSPLAAPCRLPTTASWSRVSSVRMAGRTPHATAGRIDLMATATETRPIPTTVPSVVRPSDRLHRMDLDTYHRIAELGILT